MKTGDQVSQGAAERDAGEMVKQESSHPEAPVCQRRQRSAIVGGACQDDLIDDLVPFRLASFYEVARRKATHTVRDHVNGDAIVFMEATTLTERGRQVSGVVGNRGAEGFVVERQVVVVLLGCAFEHLVRRRYDALAIRREAV